MLYDAYLSTHETEEQRHEANEERERDRRASWQGEGKELEGVKKKSDLHFRRLLPFSLRFRTCFALPCLSSPFHLLLPPYYLLVKS